MRKIPRTLALATNTQHQDSGLGCTLPAIVSNLREVITSIKSLTDSVPDNSRDTYDSLISHLDDSATYCKDLMSDLLERDASQLKRQEMSRMQALARVREERAAEIRKKIEVELKKGEEGDTAVYLVFQRASVSQFDGKPIALRSTLGCLVRRVLSLAAKSFCGWKWFWRYATQQRCV